MTGTGCAPSYDFNGKWVGKRDLTAVQHADPVIAANLSKVILEVRKDGRFELFTGGLPYSGTSSGNGTSLQLNVDSVAGRPAPPGAASLPTPTLTAQSEGSILYKEGADAEAIVLKRESQPRS